MKLTGVHHVTAVTRNAKNNHDFYTNVLGLRLVKKTVNQDDVSAYHLFYADGAGSPGTDLTFFEWPAVPEVRGTNSIVATGLRVSSEEDLAWWKGRLSQHGVPYREETTEGAIPTVVFTDPEGQRLQLVVGPHGTATSPWEGGPVPREHQILGLGPVTLSVAALAPTEHILVKVLEMEKTREYVVESVATHVYRMQGEGPASEIHVREEKDAPAARLGAGGVHHVAFRTPDHEQYVLWDEKLRRSRVAYSGQVNRYYFESLYLREPNGILFEIATDGPGFAVDESLSELGRRLSLPPFLESRRTEIELGLKPF